jgi:hypothetical protein
MIYKNLIILTCHTAKDSLQDLIENIFKFNNDVCVVINNGIFTDSLDDLKNNHVHIVQRSNSYEVFEKFISMIPLHMDVWDYISANNIEAEHVTTLSSNQLFVQHGFYDFIKNFQASYFARPMTLDLANIRNLSLLFNDYVDDLGTDSFVYWSNHDGMFYKWEIFSNMMTYFKEHRTQLGGTDDEIFYPAYLIKNIGVDSMVEFSKYNHFEFDNFNPYDPADMWHSYTLQNVTEDTVVDCISQGMFLVKRVGREYNDPCRQYIRSLN